MHFYNTLLAQPILLAKTGSKLLAIDTYLDKLNLNLLGNELF